MRRNLILGFVFLLTIMMSSGVLAFFHYEENKITGSVVDSDFRGWTFCSPSNLCSEGQGDCDSNRDCNVGLVCLERLGKDFCVKPESTQTPQIPDNVQVPQISDKSVRLSWSQSPNAVEYVVRNTDSRLGFRDIVTQDLSANVVNLRPNTRYCWTVSARNQIGSATSQAVCETTLNSLEPPTNLRASAEIYNRPVGQTSERQHRIALRWTSASGVEAYSVYTGSGKLIHQGVQRELFYVSSVPSLSDERTFVNLNPSTTYCFQVTSIDSSTGRESSKSEFKCARTLDDPVENAGTPEVIDNVQAIEQLRNLCTSLGFN